MTSGTREDIVISSTPSGAMASLRCDGHPVGDGVTPLTITIRRNAGDCDLRLTKDGYQDKTILIEQGVNPAYWANMLFTPLVPGGVYLTALGDSGEKAIGISALGVAFVLLGADFRTGAVHTHRPREIAAVLQPKQ